MTGKRMADGTVTLVDDSITALAKRVRAAGKPWPWPIESLTNGDTRAGIAWPFTDERQAGIYKAGQVVLCVLDISGVVFVLGRWPFFVVKDTMRTTDNKVEIQPGLSGIVARLMTCGINRYAVQADKADAGRAFMHQLYQSVAGVDHMAFDSMVAIDTFCGWLVSRAQVDQIIQPKDNITQMADDRIELKGRPGPLEIATAICCGSFETSKLRAQARDNELRSLYPLPKGARVFGG